MTDLGPDTIVSALNSVGLGLFAYFMLVRYIPSLHQQQMESQKLANEIACKREQRYCDLADQYRQSLADLADSLERVDQDLHVLTTDLEKLSTAIHEAVDEFKTRKN